jgi:hypothetical protein
MECVRRAIVVEVENPPPELSAVEEPYRRIAEEVAAYVAERGTLEKEKYNVPPLQKAVPPTLPANPASHEPMRRDRQVFSEAEERRPHPQAPPRGGAGFDEVR